MTLKGESLIGRAAVRGSQGEIVSVDMTKGGEPLAPKFAGLTKEEIDRACGLAWAAFDPYRELPLEERARFLETIADNILAIGDELILRCMAESGLPRGRIEGERGRTVGQLKLFAQVVRDGSFLDPRIDPALPDRKPMPRPDLRLRNVPLGPVAVFSASNFPLAFSVAGGDTASALAAGCPVVAKAHSAHPGTSELVGRAVQKAVADCGLPEGVFSLLYVSGYQLGQSLVADPRIKAVGFTGSRRGGTSLMKVAAERPEPIPVYAEMSSINPVILLPGALKARPAEIARGFVGALTLGAGQFCTNPGLILAIEGPGLDEFLKAASEAVAAAPASTMLTPGIFDAYEGGAAKLGQQDKVETLARGQEGGPYQGRPGLFCTGAPAFKSNHAMQDEIFGASSLVVRCKDEAELVSILESLEGQLTAALHIEESDHAAMRRLLPLLERKAGRILVNGFGTGVEVAHAMVHGGPFPSTSDGRSTSVGTLAIARFLRPVCYQDLPEDLLPVALRDGNPLNIWRRIDGKLQQG
ncbi:aldehyde dehydrogenase (NADP(+)) [Enterovirga sp.]|uniref:aldehyde dehydrogenase (NADP(+)) n=1 Tax=Enterovirga sp. TaxID=2026350 RepID=UPI002D1387E4|nr:aldehyde dehydrogenase (NADP(+)) [Enterovirga sp.]HMO28514.1 aldehyde dehydrogenase (NADP(+)) [Enterovirga sp.]